MTVVHRIAIGIVGVVLMLAVAACQSASATEVTQAVNSPPLSTAQQPDEVMWGRVPYCNCLADSATANVASALKHANLNVNLKELSPNEGWLYFAVRFDPHSATAEEVRAAMKAGGAEILDGPP